MWRQFKNGAKAAVFNFCLLPGVLQAADSGASVLKVMIILSHNATLTKLLSFKYYFYRILWNAPTNSIQLNWENNFLTKTFSIQVRVANVIPTDNLDVENISLIKINISLPLQNTIKKPKTISANLTLHSSAASCRLNKMRRKLVKSRCEISSTDAAKQSFFQHTHC